MKLKSLVIVDQEATVTLFLSPVHTARHALEIDQMGKRIKAFFLYINFLVLLK